MLYKPNNICFKTKLEQRGWSRTAIKNHLWKYHYMFTFLYDRYYHSGCNDQYPVVILNYHSSILKNTAITMTNGGKIRVKFTTEIMKDLKEWNVIFYKVTTETIETPTCSYHKKTATYKFWDEILEDGIAIWNDPTVKQGNKGYIPNTSYLSSSKPLTGIYQQLEDNLSLVTIDAVAARNRAYVDCLNRVPLRDKRNRNFILIRNRHVTPAIRDQYLYVINAIDRQDWNCKVDFKSGTGRLFNRITGLKSEYRNFLKINGKDIIEIDVSNCQPLIFAIYLKTQYLDGSIPKDVKQYIDLCSIGEFYSEIKPLVTVPSDTISYKDFKVKFFANVFFSTGNKNSKWVARFNAHFPNVYAAISAYKVATSNKRLAIDMQKMETDIMLQGVAKQLFKDGITEFFTVHDAIYTTAEYYDQVKDTVFSCFSEAGLAPHVKSKK